MNLKLWLSQMNELGINLSDNQLSQLEIFFKMLIEKNKVMNLTAITEKKEVYYKHFYDSASIIKIIDLNKLNNLCDFGSGAGFPGIILGILFPNLKITLVEAQLKRVNFLNEVIEKLNLKNIKAIHSRIEDYVIKHVEEYDVMTARAVAKLSILLEWSTKGIKIGGYFIAMKTDSIQELEESKNAINQLNLKVINKIDFILPEFDAKRSLICLKKIDKTNKKYPRKYSEIKRHPL